MKNLNTTRHHFVILFIFSVMFCNLSFGQSTVTRDTTLIPNGKIEVSLLIETDLSFFEEIEISQISIDNGDTLTSFNGIYNTIDDDPSSFQEFEMNEINNTITIMIGVFDPNSIRSIIVIQKSSGLLEEFIIN